MNLSRPVLLLGFLVLATIAVPRARVDLSADSRSSIALPAQGGMSSVSEPPVDAPTRSPDVVMIDALALHYAPVEFDHGLHASMSEIVGDCANCHHETEGGDMITGCGECHPQTQAAESSNRPSLRGAYHRQCLDCHKEWSDSNSCGFCHEEVGAARKQGPELLGLIPPAAGHTLPKPTYTYHTTREAVPLVTFHHEDHVQRFGIPCAECHQSDRCDRCHGTGAPRQTLSREQSCMPCHATSGCVECHQPAERARFDHAVAADWSLEPSHAALECEACHGPARGATYATPAAGRCLACHQQAHGMGLEPGGAAVPLLGSHAFLECTECHRGPEAAPATSCAGCHDDKVYPDWLPGLTGEPGIR